MGFANDPQQDLAGKRQFFALLSRCIFNDENYQTHIHSLLSQCWYSICGEGFARGRNPSCRYLVSVLRRKTKRCGIELIWPPVLRRVPAIFLSYNSRFFASRTLLLSNCFLAIGVIERTMASIKVLLLGFLLFISPSISQDQSFVPTPPSWYIYNPIFYAWVDKNGTHIGASTYIFRSSRRPFTSTNIYSGVHCIHHPDYPDTPLKDGWMSCQEYLDAPEGEKQLSPDLYERLKWRLLDLKVNNVTLKFETVTLQVVNALPARLYKIGNMEGKPRYRIKTYSANFTITSAIASCSPPGSLKGPDVLPGAIDCSIGPMAGCRCSTESGYDDPSLCNAQCNYLKAPVAEQLHESDNFKKLYWNLDTNPTMGPPPDVCQMGIRNCISAIDWTGVGWK